MESPPLPPFLLLLLLLKIVLKVDDEDDVNAGHEVASALQLVATSDNPTISSPAPRCPCRDDGYDKEEVVVFDESLVGKAEDEEEDDEMGCLVMGSDRREVCSRCSAGEVEGVTTPLLVPCGKDFDDDVFDE